MPRRTSPGVQSAIEYIIGGINSGKFTKIHHLPPIKTLSSDAKVSITTMCKATQRLKEQGVLEGLPSQRIRVCVDRFDPEECVQYQEQSNEIPSKEESQYAWKRVREQIRKDILNGVYPPGDPFPSHKEIKNRYNVAFLTLKKSLDSLCAEGVIVPCKRTFMVPPLFSGKSNVRIVFFTMVEGPVEFNTTGEFIRYFEVECKKAGIQYDVVKYFLDDGELRFEDATHVFSDYSDDDNTLGYLVPVKAPDAGWDSVLRTLGHFKKPIAILDDIGGWKLNPLIPSVNAQIFCSRVSSHPARKMARYLYGLGHRKIAYISPFHASAWSQNRLKGFVDVYDSADNGSEVVPFVFNNPPLIHEFYSDEACRRAGYDSLLAFYNEWKKGKPKEFLRLTDFNFLDFIPNELFSRGELHMRTGELFEKAAKNSDITAWVCANDEIALAALHYCEEKGIEVPGQVSVVGFDDRYDSVKRGLTSYNFNDAAIFHSMIRYLLNRRTFPAKPSRRPVEIEGMIMERLTSGVARR
ncbi:MAG: GntR family transcriptional regulator [Chitinivibrionales bacterium]|nr:GntR family transcriptional regulator [Chitinivibrionales bacterium]